MLSVGAIHFEDRFCANSKGGTRGSGCVSANDSAWGLLQLAVEKPWSITGGPLFGFLAKTGLENTPFAL